MSGPGPGALTPTAIAIVPARLGSTRLPEKMLLDATGTPLFAHTLQAVERCAAFERVVLATDDAGIEARAVELGFEAVLTDPAHTSGTDRVAEALAGLEAVEGPRWEVVVNVQGDEPEIDAGDLTRLVAAFVDERVEAATMWAPLEPRLADDPAVVKVVAAGDGRALYFSRAALPALGHGGEPCGRRRHIGVYAYRPAALREFVALPSGELERAERLEQLRWLGAGRSMHLVRAERPARGIDTEADYAAFVARAGAR